jgi:RNA 2',3'-cyclic 3'-phosphodiesterase
MPRLFVALAMPEEIAAELDRLCVGLPGVRWTEPEDFHLTLRFIGEVDHPTFYEIGEVLASISLAPFDLVLRGLGTFPPRGAPHTLWVGVEPNEGLQLLRRRIDRSLREIGLEPERRNFMPHVTIGRFREVPPEDRFGSWIARRSLFRTTGFPVSSFNLFSSVLRSDGALHHVEASYDFVTGVMERV